MPIRLQRILVPLDGSDLAESVLPVVERLARDHEAEVVLLEVLEGQRTREAELEERGRRSTSSRSMPSSAAMPPSRRSVAAPT